MAATETTPLVRVQSHLTQELPPLKKRITQVLCAIIWCLFAAGPVFGFAAFKPILISEGIYKDLCEISTNGSDSDICVERDLKLNLMFTLAAVITNATALLVGGILDHYGPRSTGIIGSIIIFFAALLLANGQAIEFFDAYLYGYIALAFGGPFVFISCFQLANSFPGNSGFILALLTGSFDSSSALFLFYRIIYQNDYIKNLTIKRFFTVYLIIPIFIFLCQLFIMPKESYKTVETLAKIGETGLDETGLPMDPNDSRYTEEQIEEHNANPRSRRASVYSNKSVFEEIAEQNLQSKSNGVFGAMHGKTVKQQIMSPWFILTCLFTTIQMLRINYFVATVKSQMEYYFSSLEVATEINHFFDIALPVGGILSIPFIGLLLDNCTTLVVLVVLVVISMTIGIFGMTTVLSLQYIGITILVVYRPFYYTCISDFCAKVFGFKTFGTVYGAITCFSGLCNLFQALLDESTHSVFNMNPNPVNSLLVGLTFLIGGSMITFVKSQESANKKNYLIRDAMDSAGEEAEIMPA